MSEFDATCYDADLESALEEIRAALNDPPREKGYVTVYEYAASEGISVPQARRDLERGLANGSLEKRLMKIRRKWRATYRVITNESR